MLMLAYITSECRHKNSTVVIITKRKTNLSRENIANIVAVSQPKSPLLYHNQLHGFVLFPLWSQVNITFSIETAWTTVAHKDKFHFLVTFADVIQWRQQMYGIGKSVKLLKLQIFIPLLIKYLREVESWKNLSNISNMSWDITFWIW